MRLRLSSTLTDRPFNAEGVWYYLTRELVPVVKQLLRALIAPPGAFSFAGNAATLDLKQARDFFALNLLTGDSAITLANGLDGCEGTIVVQQDATGGHLLTVDADGRTVLRVDPFVGDDPNPAASSVTRYRYLYLTVNDVPYVVLERTYLL